MREAVHIFLKDSRQLRYPILIVLAWTCVFAFAGAQQLPYNRPFRPDLSETIAYVVQTVSDYLFPVGWAYLVSQAFHADAIPGDRQFWLTRPYRRASLFGAKALFVLAYVTVPLTLAQGAIVVLQGLPLWTYLPGLVWEQVLTIAIAILPVAAVASVTSKLAQFVGVALVAPILFFATGMLEPWQGMTWIRTGLGVAAVVAVTGAVLFVQFTRRRTGASRLMALVGILVTVVTLTLLPWHAAFALQSRLAGSWEGTLAAELTPPAPRTPKEMEDIRNRRFLAPNRYAQLMFQVTGQPAGTPIVCEAGEITIDSPDGHTWSTALDVGNRYVPVSSVPDGCPTSARIPNSFSDAVADRRVKIHATLYITVFGAEQSTDVPIGPTSTVVRNGAVCEGTRYRAPEVSPGRKGFDFTRLECRAAFKASPLLLRSELPTTGLPTLFSPRRLSYSPFPADLRIQPVEGGVQNFQALDVVTLRTVEPVAHVRTSVDVTDVNLKDYER